MTPSTLSYGNDIPTANTSTLIDRTHEEIDKATEQAAPVLERATTTAQETLGQVAHAAAPAIDWAAKNGQQLARRSNQLAEACGVYVKAHPLASVAGALALGYLAGRLLR